MLVVDVRLAGAVMQLMVDPLERGSFADFERCRDPAVGSRLTTFLRVLDHADGSRGRMLRARLR